MTGFSIDGRKNKTVGPNLSDICEAYYLGMRKYCASRVKSAYAEVIVNDVFVLFCEKWEYLEDTNYKSYLYETADRLLKNFGKKQMRQIEKETHMDEQLSETLSYEQNFDNISDIGDEEIERCKNEIIELLSEQDSQLYEMKYIQKLTIAKISMALSISETNVKQRLFRLREKIKEEASKKLRHVL